MPERMHAVVQQAFGGPEVLEVAEVDRPAPLGTEVLVRVEAVGVNPVEPLIRSGRFPLIGQPPFILGWDISGVIEDSEGVTRFDVGDEVYGMPFFPRAASAYAQYVAAPSRQLARKPPGLSHVQASAAKHEFVRSLGADELIDHQTCDFAAVAGGLDVVLDSLGGEIARRSISVLRPGGMLVTIVGRRDTIWPPVPELRGAASPACPSSPTIRASKPWPDWSIPGSSVSTSRRRCRWPRRPRPTSSWSPAAPPARSC
jgi:NADPH:quinone reductase-like Zn-dependent oxidoreductase